MHRRLIGLVVWSLLGARAIVAAETTTPDLASRIEFFERQVRPLLTQHCATCHSAETKPAGGLRVDDHQGLLAGGNGGPAVVPGKPAESLLLQRVLPDAKRRMPAEGEPLSAEQIALLTRWIEEGAVWPKLEVAISAGDEDYEQLRQTHWAFQPLQISTIPEVQLREWPRDEIDHFLLARLEAEGLAPVGDARKEELLRRLTFDLTGLPPTPDEMDAFLQDDSSFAVQRVVDRLLESPAFGVHWGRAWLDLARYGESTGPSRNIPYPHAWRYRDYVVDAVNRDVPFPDFVREQIAGDLLPARDADQRNRNLIATGFLALGVKDVNQRFKVRFIMDNVDEQIDVVSRSILGLTVSCARCHDHKFDPIPQADYYALAGIFTSSEMFAGLRSQMGGSGLAYYVPDRLIRLAGEIPPADPAEVARLQAEVEKAKERWLAVRGTPEGLARGANGVPLQRTLRLELDKAEGQLQALTDPALHGLAAHGIREAEIVGDTQLRVRGEAEQLGPHVPRGFLGAISTVAGETIPADQSGRLQLANWLVADSNPVTIRVFVNRVWSRLFGRGLVSTVDNFGVSGSRPTHPELLDYLATTTQADGWSLKRLVRRLVLTRAYQLETRATQAHLAKDPENRWLWRHTPRRLTAEEVRDAVLAVSGQLNLTPLDGSPAQKLKMVEMRDNGPEARTLHEQVNALRVRSLYLPQLRGVTPKTLEPFDPVDQTLVTAMRDVTTVPGQALFLLNSRFVQRESQAFARRLIGVEASSVDARVALAYRLALGRAPAEHEVARVHQFLAQYSQAFPADRLVAVEPKPVEVADANSSNSQAEVNPDEVDPIGLPIREASVQPKDVEEAAWMAFTQALLASAEFRYVR